MANRFWVGGLGTWDSSSTTNWSATTGGASGASAPTSADDVFFDNLSGTGFVQISINASCKNFTATTLSTSLQFDGNYSPIYVYGSVNLGANATYVFNPLDLSMSATTTGNTVTISNTSLVQNITYNSTGGGWTQGACTISNAVSVTGPCSLTLSGSLTGRSLTVYNGATFVGGALTHNLFDTSVFSPNSTVVINNATANLTNTTFNIGTNATYPSTATWSIDALSTLTFTGATINMGSSAVSPQVCTNNFEGGGFTYGTVSGAVNITGAYNTISGNNSFYSLSVTGAPLYISPSQGSYLLISDTTVTNALTIQGNSISAYRMLVVSGNDYAYSTTANPATITLSGAGAKTFKWIDIQDITLTVSGGATPTYISIGNCLGNTGFTFPTAVTRYASLKLPTVTITDSLGNFSCTATTLVVGQIVDITGAISGTGTISSYNGTYGRYYIIATNGTTTFQLSLLPGGFNIVTTAGTTTGASFCPERNYSSTAMWSATSGGAAGATVPLPQDNVVFDSLTSQGYINVDMPILGNQMTMSSYPTYLTRTATGGTIFGNFDALSMLFFTGFALGGRSSITLPNLDLGTTTSYYLTVGATAYGITCQLSSNVSGVNLTVNQGTFYTNNFNFSYGGITVGIYNGVSVYPVTLNIGTSTIEVPNWDFGGLPGSSFSGGKIKILNNASNSYFRSRPATYGVVELSSTTTADRTIIFNQTTSGTATIAKLTSTSTRSISISLQASQTFTISEFEINGTQSAPVFITSSSTASVQATIAIGSPRISSFVAYRKIIKSGASALNAVGVANLGINSGINFPSTLYGIVYSGSVGSSVGGSFTVPSNFSGSSMLVAYGGGGGGAKRSVTTGSAGGGGAGALAVVPNPTVSAGQPIYFSAGSGGVGGTSAAGQSGGSGSSSWMNISSNVSPSTTAQGVSALGGLGSSLGAITGGAGGSGVSSTGVVVGAGGNGGAGGGTTSAGAGGGGSGPSLFRTTTSGYVGGAGATGNSGGAGGGGYNGAGGVASTTTGGLGGLNSLSTQATGGTAGNTGSNGTSGGGGGGGGGATTGLAGTGGVGDVAPDFQVTSFNGSPVSATIGPTGGGGGGGTATSTGGGGAGGAAGFGAGGGGGGRGGTVANNGSGGNGGVGYVLFVYTLSTPTTSQGSIIG
jgi:hypothetical protein